jgi:hypothetical protein
MPVEFNHTIVWSGIRDQGLSFWANLARNKLVK